MITLEIRREILEHIKNQQQLVEHNTKLLNIFEGDLLTYVLEDLKITLSPKAFERIKTRVAPINVLRKIIDKLSTIYQQKVMRTVEYGTPQDSELLSIYEDQFQVNKLMNQSNEFFNLFKNNLLHPYYNPKERIIKLRTIPSNQFTVWSNDPIDPTNPTHIILYYGKRKDKQVYCIYDEFSFVFINENNEIESELMQQSGNPDGIIPWGQMPFIYTNKSLNKIIPIADTDTLKMTKLMPILLSDLNYAVMYQAFSIIYGIDIEDKNLEMNPSAFWHFKSDPNQPNQKPEIGMIKPQVDISQTLQLIQSQLAFWLETRGIKAGSIGSMDAQNAASGISKMIDEADTYQDRSKQITYFEESESQLWDLVLKKMHPYFVSKGAIDNKYIFTPTAEVETKFPEQKPFVSRTDLVNTLKVERDAGFTSTERAIEMLNPDMTETDIAELMLEIEAERTIQIPEAELPDGSELAPTITENSPEVELDNGNENPKS